MSLFDPHIHMDVRSCDDYEQMALAQVQRILIPCSPSGERRASRQSYAQRCERLLLEVQRAAQFGIRADLALSVNAADIADIESARSGLDEIAQRLDSRHVVAVGEISFRTFSPQERELCTSQLALAQQRRLPAIVEAPISPADFDTMLRLLDTELERGTIDCERVCLVDLNIDKLQKARVLQLGGYGIPVSPPWEGPFALREKLSHLDVLRILDQYGAEGVMLNSGLHIGYADPLGLPRTVLRLKLAGVDAATLRALSFENAEGVFGARA